MSKTSQAEFKISLAGEVAFRFEKNEKELSFRRNGNDGRIQAPCLPLIAWIKWAVSLLGSDFCRAKHPELHVPIRYLGEDHNAEVTERMRDNIARAQGSKKSLPEYCRSFFRHLVPVKRGSLTFFFDPQRDGFSFADEVLDCPLFSFEIACEFACLILRDTSVRDLDGRHYVEWLQTRGEKAWTGIELDRAFAEHHPWETSESAAFVLLKKKPEKTAVVTTSDGKELLASQAEKFADALRSNTPRLPADLRPVANSLLSLVDSLRGSMKEKGIRASVAADFSEESIARIRQTLADAKEDYDRHVEARRAEILKGIAAQVEEARKALEELQAQSSSTSDFEAKASELQALEQKLIAQLAAAGDKERLIEAEKTLRERSEDALTEAKKTIQKLQEEKASLQKEKEDAEEAYYDLLRKPSAPATSAPNPEEQGLSKLAMARKKRSGK